MKFVFVDQALLSLSRAVTGGLKNSNRGNERLEKRLKANDNVISSEVWHFFRIWMGSA